ncbi:unnamed protein product [Closterium sp. NIES-53]
MSHSTLSRPMRLPVPSRRRPTLCPSSSLFCPSPCPSAERKRQRRSLHLCQRQRRQQLMLPPPPSPFPLAASAVEGGEMSGWRIDQQPVPPFPLPLSTAALVAVWGGREERGVGGMRAVKGGRQGVADEAAPHL